jgi:hypothetical protein
MPQPDFTLEFSSEKTPIEVFDTINDVPSWWTGDIDGSSALVGDVFTYRHEDVHRSTQRVLESVPGRRVAWAVDEASINFTEDPAEWVGTRITFDLSPVAAGGTLVHFTHIGLTPEVECFDACSSAWTYYVGESLRAAIQDTHISTRTE